MNKKILIKNLPEEERPREKLLKKGADSLSNEELLAIVLGSGNQRYFCKGISREDYMPKQYGIEVFDRMCS